MKELLKKFKNKTPEIVLKTISLEKKLIARFTQYLLLLDVII